MKKLLVISSSPNLSQSYTRRMVHTFADNFKTKVADADVAVRDLGENPTPHLDEITLGAFFTPPELHNEEQKDVIRLSNTLIEELEAADVIVIGAPMHNFSIPSVLKAYFDHIARAGRTFRYTSNGPEGMLKDKRVFVLTARGGDYSRMPMSALDHQEPYLRTMLGFVGLEKVDFIHCQGVAMGEEASTKAFDDATERISNSIDELRNP